MREESADSCRLPPCSHAPPPPWRSTHRRCPLSLAAWSSMSLLPALLQPILLLLLPHSCLLFFPPPSLPPLLLQVQSRACVKPCAPLCIAATHALCCSCVLCMLSCSCSACGDLCWCAERLCWQRDLRHLQAALVPLQRKAAQARSRPCVSRMLYVSTSVTSAATSDSCCHRRRSSSPLSQAQGSV